MKKSTSDQFYRLSLFSNDRQLDSFIKSIEKKIKENPNELKTRKLQIDLYRKSGKLTEAKILYEKFLESFSESQFKKEGQQSISQSNQMENTGFSIAPIYLQDNFLDDKDSEKILEYAIENKSRFSWANTNSQSPTYTPEKRKTLKLWDIKEIRDMFAKKIQKLTEQARRDMGIPFFNVKKMEIKMTNHLNGHFFQVHADNNGIFGTKTNRVITWMYYFNKQPQAFKGGELLLFDTNLASNQYIEGNFSKIHPKHNRLIAFPSCFYHAVLPTHMDSNKFSDGRFAISCHTHFDSSKGGEA